MKILLIGRDDGLLRQIADLKDLDAYGIDCVVRARTCAEACSHLRAEKFPLIFTELHLPDGSGIDVLEFLREIRLRTTTVLWNETLDLPAMREAMHLFAYDFVIGAQSEEDVRALLRAAMAGVSMTNRINIFYESFTEIRAQSRSGYWAEILLSPHGDKPADPLLLGHYGEYNAFTRFVLCILSLADSAETLPSWKEYAVQNVLRDLIEEKGFSLDASLPLNDGDVCCVIRMLENASYHAVPELLQKMVQFARRELGGRLNCYYSEEVYLDTARKAFEPLYTCYVEDVARLGAVIAAAEFQPREVRYALPELREWELMVNYRQADELVRRIHGHLDRLAAHGDINRAYLKSLRIQMMQMLQSVLKEHGIGADSIYAEQRFDTLRENSLRSVEHMKRYLEYIVRSAISYLDTVDEAQSVVGRVKEFIDRHFNEDISRNSIARMVFLNPDYLARVFKRETGMSLGAYIKDRRIEEAKKLLSGTNVQISEIAVRVGYDNSSYFSHIFHECTGLSPHDYRRQNMQSKKS